MASCGLWICKTLFYKKCNCKYSVDWLLVISFRVTARGSEQRSELHYQRNIYRSTYFSVFKNSITLTASSSVNLPLILFLEQKSLNVLSDALGHTASNNLRVSFLVFSIIFPGSLT